MKFNSSILALLLSALMLCGASAQAQNATGKGQGTGQGQGQAQGEGHGREMTVATTDTVNVSLTTGSGSISVRGWDRKEVRIQVSQPGSKIEVHKASTPETNAPAMRLEVSIVKDPEEEDDGACESDNDVVINAPRGATVYLKTQDGDIEVDDVAEAHIETVEGRIEARRILKATDITSVGGDVALEDASGRARLSSLSGVIEVKDLRPLGGSDFLKIKTASGDILLDKIGPARVEVNTISGELRLMGPLVRGATYDFTTTNGDVTIFAPADSSFKLNAKVSEGGEIATDFQLEYKDPVSPNSPQPAGRLQGTYGAGDATINLVSFSGTLRLRKQ
jgi:DUF4097 and DUF4098 domain-containing protein YvlB